MRNRVSNWLLIAIVAITAAFWWLMIDTDRGMTPAKPIHIGELRMLAATLPGQRPTGVTYSVLGTRMIDGDYFAAGIGLKRRPLAIVTWSLPVPGSGPVVIDPGPPPAESSVGEFETVDPAMQARIDAEARSASLVLYTQGHLNDLSQAMRHLGKAGMGPARPAQNPVPPPLSFTTAQAVAPGIVVIPADSYFPGARLIYVQLADGREFLFTGSIAPLTENWVRLRARSHLAAYRGPVQNRAETYAWLRTIRQLRLEALKMKVVPGHDYIWLTKQTAAGVITEFPPEPGPSAPIAHAP